MNIASSTDIAPIPTLDELLALLPRMRTEPPIALRGLLDTYGPVVRLTADGLPLDVLVVNEPTLIRDALLDAEHRFDKGAGLQAARQLLGDGLLTSEGDVHARQRRIVSTAFRRNRLAGLADTMARRAAAWSSGLPDGVDLDLHAEFARVTLDVVGATLFDVDLNDTSPVVRQALDDVLRVFGSRTPVGEMLGERPSDEEEAAVR